MVYPDLQCWDNEGDIDPEGFNTNSGIVPLAIKAMVERVTATSTTGTESSTGGEESSSGGEGSTGGEESSTGGDIIDSCAQYQASITEALDSIESVRASANGRISSHTQFDGSLLEGIPTSCDLSDALQDIRTQKLRLRHIVIRAATDQLRAERAHWMDIRTMHEELRGDDDALVAKFDSLYWI